MQEVFPAIETCWTRTDSESRLINVDSDPLREHIHFIMNCDAMIVIAFNETISRFIVNMRKQLNLQIPIIFHLYGYATIGCWPLERFGTLENLRGGDIFIGTCEGDVQCMNLTFSNAIVKNIPYPYIPYDFEKNCGKGKKIFSYVGRISDQKNVDTLIRAYHLLKTTDGLQAVPPLYIYGDEDHLGFPNVGVPSTNCLERIEQLIVDYKLEENVFLMGFKAREEIYQVLGSDHIFVSASTHSDENFGMAAMRSLAIGGRAVLTDWGGHTEFKKHHAERVRLVDVRFENNRPVVDPELFAMKMRESLSENIISQNNLAPYFHAEEVVRSFNKILDEIEFKSGPLIKTENAFKIYGQQLDFEKMGFKQRAFSGFDDPVLHSYLSAYKGQHG